MVEQNQELVIPEFGPCNPDEETCDTTECCNVIIQPQKAKDRICMKCKQNKSNRLLKSEQVCNDCYQFTLTHRFKNTLVRHCKIQKDYPNLVAISGGSNSMAMLHLLWNCLSGNKSQKKMFFKVHILYIDESMIYKTSKEEADRRKQLIIDVCLKYKFSYSVIQLAHVYSIQKHVTLDSPPDLDALIYKEQHAQLPLNQTVSGEDDSRILDLISSVEPPFQADLVFYLKRLLIADFCLKYNFKRVLVATTGEGVSCKLLSQLAKGRGASVAQQVSYCGEMYYDQRVNFCKPMRDFLQKEVAVYCHSNQIEIIAQPTLPELNNKKFSAPTFGSTDFIIDKFFSKLQSGYNVNTVPTVIRLTGKLQGQQALISCPLCLGQKDEINNLLEVGSTVCKISQQKIEFISSPQDWFTSQIEKAFCFGCKRICFESKNKDALLKSLPCCVTDNI